MKRIYLCILSFTIVLSAMAGSGKFIIISGDKGVLSEVANAQLLSLIFSMNSEGTVLSVATLYESGRAERQVTENSL